MKCQCCYHDTNNVSKDNRKFNENPKHLSVAIYFYLILSGNTFLKVTRLTLVTTFTY